LKSLHVLPRILGIWVNEVVYGAEAEASRKTLLSAPEYKITTDCSSSIRDSLQEFSR